MSENSSPIDRYIQAANAYADYLVAEKAAENAIESQADDNAADNSAIKKLVDLFNQKGQEYYGHHPSGYVAATVYDTKATFEKEVYNKAEFIKKKREEIGADEDITDEELLNGNKAAFDPEFSHTIFINISDPANPTLVDPPEGFITPAKDYVLTWDDVQQLPDLYPDGNIIAANMDGIQMIFFPIPTKPMAGGLKKRSRRTRKVRKSKGKRSKQRQSKKYK